jgi:hypothetical protein
MSTNVAQSIRPPARLIWSIAAGLLLVLSASCIVAAAPLGYHDIRTDAEGKIIPWSHDDPAAAYDHVVRLVWKFWVGMEKCPNGVPYNLQHQVWKPEHDARGIGGDQISMALSSWRLLYQYTGDEAVKQNMVLMADYWLQHGLSPPDVLWPNMPMPYNTDVHSGVYDGDMTAGLGFMEPDKAGSFGSELVALYRMTGERKYLDAAVKIADTMVARAQPGDDKSSPWPFRVDVRTGEPSAFRLKSPPILDTYTSNWAPTLEMFDQLIALQAGDVSTYEKTRKLAIDWLQNTPFRTNNWGPFFAIVPVWARTNTAINADTMASYILLHRDSWGPTWRAEAEQAMRWVDDALSHRQWSRYGVFPINEQTGDMRPGNSHTARHGSVELIWCEATGDWSRKDGAIRRLNWATYMVDADGKNRFPRGEISLTDGYGDFVRHYLRAMAACPELAPADQNHLLRTTSVIKSIRYGDDQITYEKPEATSHERLKLGAWSPGEVVGGTMTWDPQSRVLEIDATAPTVTIRRAP